MRDSIREKKISEGGVEGLGAGVWKYSGFGYLGDMLEDITGTGRGYTSEDLINAYKYVYGKLPEKQALGGIFDYKPGGEIVRVAEASDEIVAPAKRGADGKLGLEVSGVMLDNSRLLQSLVKINEGQASMIASLNNQMANMNSNFEKLVYEQRQANRLAV
jgi:hypothetical protein